MGKYKNNQVTGLLHKVTEYLIYSTYGAGCSTYNHSYESTRRLNTLAFKIADLVVEELNLQFEETVKELNRELEEKPNE
jgi:hypothetical protein